MVTSITSGLNGVGAAALGAEARLPRAPGLEGEGREATARISDRVELSASSWSSARESVRQGLSQVHLALAVGHDAQGMLLKVQEFARTGGEQADLDALLRQYASRVEAAIGQGASLLAGEDMNVDAEPGGAPVQLHGADLRLKGEPSWGDVIAIPADADAGKPAALARAAQKSLDALQGAMEKLLGAARALEAHQGFLSAIESAGAVNGDLNADSARLAALQVRQGLERIAGPIANADPQAVLALFRG